MHEENQSFAMVDSLEQLHISLYLGLKQKHILIFLFLKRSRFQNCHYTLLFFISPYPGHLAKWIDTGQHVIVLKLIDTEQIHPSLSPLPCFTSSSSKTLTFSLPFFLEQLPGSTAPTKGALLIFSSNPRDWGPFHFMASTPNLHI